MKKFFNQLFSDNNSINEKSVVGFIAFLMMCLFAGADIVTGFLGKPLVVNEFIFNSFLILVLGSFAIGSVDKFINKKHGSESDESETPVE
jgi:NADH:ubiquinone oxidoreductase subunit 2 (subunit N)